MPNNQSLWYDYFTIKTLCRHKKPKPTIKCHIGQYKYKAVGKQLVDQIILISSKPSRIKETFWKDLFVNHNRGLSCIERKTSGNPVCSVCVQCACK